LRVKNETGKTREKHPASFIHYLLTAASAFLSQRNELDLILCDIDPMNRLQKGVLQEPSCLMLKLVQPDLQ
jgi:hypothetical protein